MAKIPAWQASAIKKAAGATRGTGGRFAKKVFEAVGAGGAAEAFGTTGSPSTIVQGTEAAGVGASAKSLFELLGKGQITKAFQKHPTGMGIGALLLMGLIGSRLMRHRGAMTEQGLQQEAIEGQMGMSPDDMYYQAMMPELAQERRGAQNALMQAILGDQGQVMQVPGERMIGG
jgi:hypothetical protein